MKYQLLAGLLFLLTGMNAQPYTVTIPVNQLVANENTYCLLTNEDGDIVDDFFYSPFDNIIVDTIRLAAEQTPAYHLTLITNYLATRPGEGNFLKAITYYGLRNDFTVRTVSSPGVRLFDLSGSRLTYPTYELQGLKYSISKLLLPPGTTLLDKQFRRRQEVGTVDLRDRRGDAYYLFFQRSGRAPWRYHLHRPEARQTSLVFADLPDVNDRKALRLPLFETWQLDLSAYHPYLDRRVALPVTENAAGLLQERDLVLYIPEIDILTDYLFVARTRRTGERYTTAFRGNEFPAELERIDPFFVANIDLSRLSIKVSGPTGHFVLNGKRANVLDYPEEERTLPNAKVEWKMVGEIPATGHINFRMPLFSATIIERMPSLRRLHPLHFSHCNLLYLNQEVTTELWTKRLVASQDLLRDYGGTLITKDLRINAQ